MGLSELPQSTLHRRRRFLRRQVLQRSFSFWLVSYYSLWILLINVPLQFTGSFLEFGAVLLQLLFLFVYSIFVSKMNFMVFVLSEFELFDLIIIIVYSIYWE